MGIAYQMASQLTMTARMLAKKANKETGRQTNKSHRKPNAWKTGFAPGVRRKNGLEPKEGAASARARETKNQDHEQGCETCKCDEPYPYLVNLYFSLRREL